MPPLSRVFIANRGEIAVRIVRACRVLGVECVLGASEADLDSLAAQLADRTVCIGPPPASESYLRADTIVAAALGTGCDALHPGYGFLSESALLAARAAEHGVVFVGPPVAAIELAGDKLRAREAAAAAGLPVLDGGELDTLERARAFAARSGTPLMLKAAAGGGGRGIKLVDAPEDLDAAFTLASAEAQAAFGDPRLYAERFVSPARHVEVQIAAGADGEAIHLGERDCSVQRRYQKLIEESPAPALAQQTRAGLREAAVAMARAIGYRNLGTVEFVVDPASGEFFFLEVNCRIQVEHPVTEAVTGLDLVAMQLRIAAGEALPLAQHEVVIEGHAIEARLTAEDPAAGFRPSPGRLSRFHTPALEGLRVDTHCAAGASIPPYYDSLMAKLIAHGRDRVAATALLIEALDGLEVEGVETNRAVLRDVLAHDDFANAVVSTRWLEELVAA
ncbi:MAG TPA: biotin carboxylase N-terminal domain-containing protein [Solirubrobacteraceae bacterium]|jgi:acetyl-CoA carboxylase biotin carboxylase subunit|nr:biotin carboxylase N-terminal domain-containing protein [Solirubrobacteraceae bacterium]